MISFTGSTRVGRAVGRICGESIKRVSLELGGKSAQVVCADADLDLAAEKVTMGATRNAGQACVSGSRLLVERSIADSFTAQVTKRMHAIRVGDPLDAATEMGPLVSQAQFDRVTGYIAAGERDGAVLHRPADAAQLSALPGGQAGWFVRPGVFTGVTPEITYAQDVLFGPILSVFPFETVAEAFAFANVTDYGLAAGVWSRDINKALSIGRALRAGTVEVNTYMAGVPELPLSGHKQSGLGHEKGRYAIEEFTVLKTIHVQLANP
jgi:acyl-CoA reductase-like NAD-dependent aldehyde dehydrogenase